MGIRIEVAGDMLVVAHFLELLQVAFPALDVRFGHGIDTGVAGICAICWQFGERVDYSGLAPRRGARAPISNLLKKPKSKS